jgi:hypothetical protein
VIKRRKFVIRDRVKPIEISPRSSQDPIQAEVDAIPDDRAASNLDRINSVTNEEQRQDRRDYKNYLRAYKEMDK